MKIIKKQTNSKMCIVCGMENEASLKAPFYEMEDHTVVSVFKYKEFHQSYPERVHGGMITALLDEIIGRAIWIDEPKIWGVTIDINVKFRKPVPYNVDLRAIGKITRNTSRIFEGIGLLKDQNDNILAEAKATYYKLPLDKIALENIHDDINLIVEDGLTEI